MFVGNAIGFVAMTLLLVMYVKLHSKLSEVINRNDEESAGLVNEEHGESIITDITVSDYGSHEISQLG